MVVTDPLPLFTTFVSCTIAPSTPCPNPGVAVGQNGTVTVNLGTLSAGAPPLNQARVTIVVNVDGIAILNFNDTNPIQVTQISNTATVSSQTSDPNSNNNGSTADTSVNYCNPPNLRRRPNDR